MSLTFQPDRFQQEITLEVVKEVQTLLFRKMPNKSTILETTSF